jgi:uncharacterized membrane protein YoaK (UPF0700 family)
VTGGSSASRALLADERHGPLPALLLALTVLTGVVDAVSILSLGRVFVANMTGNVVFIGFAIGDAPGFSLGASLSALAGFLVGAFGGGRAVSRVGANRAALVRNAVAAESALLIIALVVAIAVGTPFQGVARDALAAMLATAMGLQNAAARRLAVPDLTTTVLTMTLTGLAADARESERGPVLVRRVLAVLMMLGGAIAGAVLVLDVNAAAALGVAAALLVGVTAAASAMARRPASWQSPAPS